MNIYIYIHTYTYTDFTSGHLNEAESPANSLENQRPLQWSTLVRVRRWRRRNWCITCARVVGNVDSVFPRHFLTLIFKDFKVLCSDRVGFEACGWGRILILCRLELDRMHRMHNWSLGVWQTAMSSSRVQYFFYIYIYISFISSPVFFPLCFEFHPYWSLKGETRNEDSGPHRLWRWCGIVQRLPCRGAGWWRNTNLDVIQMGEIFEINGGVKMLQDASRCFKWVARTFPTEGWVLLGASQERTGRQEGDQGWCHWNQLS